MAVNKVDNLLDSIRKAFSKRDSKEEELKEREKEIEIAISGITRNIEGLSYKALIEEDLESIKEHKALEKERDSKVLELEEIQKKIKALNKFEMNIDTSKQALDIYKEIKTEMETKTKALGKLTTEYNKAKIELEKKAKEVDDLYTEIGELPIGLKEVVDFIKPEDIGKTKEDIEYFKENIGRASYRIRLFDIERLKYTDKGLEREDMNQLLQGTIYIRPQRPK